MADIFIKAQQSWVPGTGDKDVFKKYDIVNIYEDDNAGRGYGLKEAWPSFIVVRINQPRNSLLYLISESIVSGERRSFKFDFDVHLSASDLNLIKNSGEWVVPVVKLSSFQAK